eukprot:UN28879
MTDRYSSEGQLYSALDLTDVRTTQLRLRDNETNKTQGLYTTLQDLPSINDHKSKQIKRDYGNTDNIVQQNKRDYGNVNNIVKTKKISSRSRTGVRINTKFKNSLFKISSSELTKQKKIGQGSFGEVFVAEYNGWKVAVKKSIDENLTDKTREELFKEMKVMSS